MVGRPTPARGCARCRGVGQLSMINPAKVGATRPTPCHWSLHSGGQKVGDSNPGSTQWLYTASNGAPRPTGHLPGAETGRVERPRVLPPTVFGTVAVTTSAGVSMNLSRAGRT